jgi:hypothetical protein
LELLKEIQAGTQFNNLERTDADLYDLGNSDDVEIENDDLFEVSDESVESGIEDSEIER